MPKYKMLWTGDYLTIESIDGKQHIGLKCHSNLKAEFAEQLVEDANLGATLRPQIEHSPDLDDANNFTPEGAED